MPTYEYACSKCGHHFEQFQPMRDEPLKKCPKCHRTGLRRLVGRGAGLIFKGSGFYVTDYPKKKAEAKPAAGESKPAAEPKGAAEPKPASKAPAAEAGKAPASAGPSAN